MNFQDEKGDNWKGEHEDKGAVGKEVAQLGGTSAKAFQKEGGDDRKKGELPEAV